MANRTRFPIPAPPPKPPPPPPPCTSHPHRTAPPPRPARSSCTASCGRCSNARAGTTRYCDASCQLEHWSNGHKKQCKKIARGGGAEQFYADAKYKEAADAAVLRAARESKMGLALGWGR